MLKRLQVFFGFVVVWIIGALMLPWLFWVIAAAILISAGVHMVVHKKLHGAGIFFSSVGVVTALIATVGFIAQSGGEVDDTDVLVADSDVGDVEAESEGEGEAKVEAKVEAEADAEAEAAETGGDAERLAQAAQGIKDALAVAKNKGKCKSLESIGAAWQLLSKVQSTDRDFKKAQKALPKLEGCRKKAAAAHTGKAKKAGAKARVAFAKALGKELKTAGIMAVAKPQGKDKSALFVKCKKATPEQLNEVTASGAIEEGTLLGRMQAVGFTKVTLAAKGKPLAFELRPASDLAEAEQELDELGLGSPLVLE